MINLVIAGIVYAGMMAGIIVSCLLSCWCQSCEDQHREDQDDLRRARAALIRENRCHDISCQQEECSMARKHSECPSGCPAKRPSNKCHDHTCQREECQPVGYQDPLICTSV